MKVDEIVERTLEFEEIKVIAGKNEAKSNRIAVSADPVVSFHKVSELFV